MSKFTEQEVLQLASGTVAIAFAVAKSDRESGKVGLATSIAEKKDIGATGDIIREVADKSYKQSALVQQVAKKLSFMSSDSDDQGKDFWIEMGKSNWETKTKEVVGLLERVDASEKSAFKGFLMAVAEGVASRSGGGDMGLQGEKSKQEAARIAHIAQLLK